MDRLAAIEQEMPKVRALTLSLARKWRLADRAELICVANLALVEAWDKFSPEREVPFGAYAAIRVRGALLDYLRSIDPLSRHERRLAGNDFQPISQFHNEDDGVGLKESDVPAPHFDVDEWILRKEVRTLLSTLLDEQTKTVIRLMFEDELNQPQVGRLLGITQSYVSLILKDAARTIRRHMAAENTRNA